MADDVKTTATPRLRFPEFRKAEGWETAKVGAKTASFTGGTPDTSFKDYYGGKIPFIRSAEIARESTELSLTEAGLEASSAKLVKRGDVLVALYGANSGDVALAKIDGAINQAILCLRSVDSNSFLYQYLSAKKDWVISTYLQGGQGNLSGDIVKSIAVGFPSPAEQQKIADCLTSLDEVIAAQGRKVEALKAHKRGLMQQLFPREGETVPRLRFPEFRDGAEWENKKLDELSRRATGHTPTKGRPEYYNGGIRWVSLADSKRLDKGLIFETEIEISQEGIDNSSAVLHPEGTVILSRDAGVGKSAITNSPMAVSQHFIAWICKSEVLSNWFLYYTLQVLKPLFERMATGSTVKTIGMPFFKEMFVIVPSVAEQQRIADCLSCLDARIAAEAEKQGALQTHKKGLMQQLFPAAAGD